MGIADEEPANVMSGKQSVILSLHEDRGQCEKVSTSFLARDLAASIGNHRRLRGIRDSKAFDAR
jgi:hypothetical protein